MRVSRTGINNVEEADWPGFERIHAIETWAMLMPFFFAISSTLTHKWALIRKYQMIRRCIPIDNLISAIDFPVTFDHPDVQEIAHELK
jgi:hypothetical protein